MLSFPNGLNVGGVNMHPEGKSQATKVKTQNVKVPMQSALERLRAVNINMNPYIKTSLYDSQYVDITSNTEYIPHTSLQYDKRPGDPFIENPFTEPQRFIAGMNRYRFVYNAKLKQLVDAGLLKDSKTPQARYVESGPNTIVTSIFNPLYCVQVRGIAPNVPLLDTHKSDGVSVGDNISNCTIRELVGLSQKRSSVLGQARYKFADFMYCYDLGKFANNHLITLRKFAHPVGDNIFKYTSGKHRRNTRMDNGQDVARLVTWFGTEDNKLENILRYSYKATWQPLKSEIQEIDSDSESQDRGIVGYIGNSINAAHNDYQGGDYVSGKSVWTTLGKWVMKSTPLSGLLQTEAHGTANDATLRNYDSNKVYTPKDTVQSTHIYEGKLEMSQDITLVFRYKLRSYDNINPKSAFLDLIGNILELTYRRGHFWGGSRKMIGPPQNMAVYKKVNAFIDNSFDKLGGFAAALGNGTLDLGSVFASISSAIVSGAGKAVDAITKGASNIASGKVNIVQSIFSGLGNMDKKLGASHALKGQLKAALGRPALYAMNSLLSGDNVGLWHLTIGNPKNPIAAIGNLILEDSTIEHTGPLGIDDFPTEIKVTVKLKNAKPRDLTEISRMYTHGVNSIYMSNARNKLGDFYGYSGFDEDKLDQAQANAHAAAVKAERSRAKDAASAAKSAGDAQKNADSGNAASATPTKTKNAKVQNQQQAPQQAPDDGQQTPVQDSKETKSADNAAETADAAVAKLLDDAYEEADKLAMKYVDTFENVDPEIKTTEDGELHHQGGYERAIELRQNIDEIA